MTHKTEYEDQIALYSLGLLQGEELREIEEHLAEGCDICRGLLKDSDTVFTSLPLCLEDTPIPKDLEKKIFEDLVDRKPPGETSLLSNFWKSLSPVRLNLGAAVSLALIIFLVISNISLRNKLEFQGKNLSEIEAKLVKEREMMDYVTNPNVDLVSLGSKMPHMDASGKLLWNKDTHKALFLVSNIPALEKGKTYQLWVIENGKPVSMGVFDVDKAGKKMMEIKLMPEPAESMQFAVTLEPEGGMPRPTGNMYLYGSL
ncbi:MAG: anti-sigma factor domain-containing protein [Thermodesulfobacteriota bacterium]